MDSEEKLEIKELTRHQRRVLGSLLEKGFTTPAGYPLTLKATVTACNQKSNRSPLVSWDEDIVQQTLDDLRAMGLVGEVHTDGGRSARYRHYMRHKFEFSEPQLAILTELMLRGRQQLGELRSRASRMVTIPDQAALRSELRALQDQGLIQANGPLDRRGVEVDHNWYRDREDKTMDATELSADDPQPTSSAPTESPSPAATSTAPAKISADQSAEIAAMRTANEQLTSDMQALMDELESLRNEMRDLNGRFDDLRQQLGG